MLQSLFRWSMTMLLSLIEGEEHKPKTGMSFGDNHLSWGYVRERRRGQR